MMACPPAIGFDDLVSRYDVFFIDQFGVLRDDERVYDGAMDALSALKKSGKTIVILSNSGLSGDQNIRRLARLGLDRRFFDHFVTSGDVAYASLSRPGYLAAGSSRCFTISSGNGTELADRLGLTSVQTAEDADIVIIAGSEAERISLDEYREILRPAANRRLPCFCTNPDFLKLAHGTVVAGAGSIANLYEELGGNVTRLGKPYPEIYEHALSICGNPENDMVVCIGDSIDHDIVGASNAGLASVLVETGILAGKSLEERCQLMSAGRRRPDFIMRRFAPSAAAS